MNTCFVSVLRMRFKGALRAEKGRGNKEGEGAVRAGQKEAKRRNWERGI